MKYQDFEEKLLIKLKADTPNIRSQLLIVRTSSKTCLNLLPSSLHTDPPPSSPHTHTARNAAFATNRAPKTHTKKAMDDAKRRARRQRLGSVQSQSCWWRSRRCSAAESLQLNEEQAELERAERSLEELLEAAASRGDGHRPRCEGCRPQDFDVQADVDECFPEARFLDMITLVRRKK